MQHHRTRLIAGSALVVGIAAIAVALLWHRDEATPDGSDAPVAIAVNHVDNNQCLGCHADQAQQWQQSHHAMAMATPSAQTVRGDFNNTAFTHDGVTTRFFLRDGQYVVNTDGPDGKLADFPIAYTFGVAPLQQYLVALPGGRLQALQVAWDTERKRWFHLLPDEKAPPGDVLHWTGRYQNANTMCISCHTTGFEKRYDAVTDSYASTWKEPNVSCQSCHGPGETHAAWARAQQSGADAPDIDGTHFGLAVGPQLLRGRQQTEICGACHSRRSELTATPTPGQPFFDNYLPVLLTEGHYHADGQQLDEVFVDGSFRQSKMYAEGVTCTDCHNPHTGKLKLEGNAVCTQCHSAPGKPTFPNAARSYDTPAHHFHPAGSAGAQCASCHMPPKTYMQLQSRPDHSIRVPRPDLTLRIGTPNACNQCHANRSAQWAADRVAQWYGADRHQETHYGEVFAAARAGTPGAAATLAQLAGSFQAPAIVRATAIDALRYQANAPLEIRSDATLDADPQVRIAAAESFGSASEAARLDALAPLLRDPVRAVRITAARVLSSVPIAQMSVDPRRDFERALAEFIASQQHALDMPGANLNLAVVYANTGRPELAEQHYLAALRIDPDFTPARANLVTLYNASARNTDAERLLREGLARQPALGELHYSLGLLLAEENRLPEAADALANAAKLLPGNARVHYNLGLALLQLGRHKPAETALLNAQKIAPEDADFSYVLAVFYSQRGNRAEMLRWARVLETMAQHDAHARELLGQLQGGG